SGQQGIDEPLIIALQCGRRSGHTDPRGAGFDEQRAKGLDEPDSADVVDLRRQRARARDSGGGGESVDAAVDGIGGPLCDLCNGVLIAQIAGDVSLLEVDADDGDTLAFEDGGSRLPDSRCCSGDDDAPCHDATLTSPAITFSLERLSLTAQSTDGAAPHPFTSHRW